MVTLSREQGGRASLRCHCVLECETRTLLSATIYTVNSTSGGTTGSGDSGTLPYVIGLANNNHTTGGSEIQFDPQRLWVAADDHAEQHSGALRKQQGRR